MLAALVANKRIHLLQCIFSCILGMHCNYFDFSNKNYFRKITEVASGEGALPPPQDLMKFKNVISTKTKAFYARAKC